MNRQQFSSFYGCCNLFYGLFKYLIHSFITARLDYFCSLYVSLPASSIVGWECRGTLFPYFFHVFILHASKSHFPKVFPRHSSTSFLGLQSCSQLGCLGCLDWVLCSIAHLTGNIPKFRQVSICMLDVLHWLPFQQRILHWIIALVWQSLLFLSWRPLVHYLECIGGSSLYPLDTILLSCCTGVRNDEHALLGILGG